MLTQSHEFVKLFKTTRMNLERLEAEAHRIFGEEHLVSEKLCYAWIHLMNADVETENAPVTHANCNMLEETTLDQLLDVLNLIEGESPQSYYDLVDTTRRAFITTSKFYDVHRNTIADACTRRLQLNIDQFYGLVDKWLKGDPSDLIDVLKSHTPEHLHPEIDRRQS